MRGYRTLQTRNATYLVFEPIDAGTKKLKVPRMSTMDDAFRVWLARVPDLDAADRARSEADLLAASALGASPTERKANLRRARALSRVLTFGAFASAAWAFVYPRPYGWAVATAYAMPVVAVALMVLRPGVFQLMGMRNDARPQLAIPFILPGLAATMRAFDFDLLAPRQLLVPALVIGVLFGGTAMLADAATRRKPALLLLLVPWFAGQAAGATTIVNCYRDPSSAVEYEAVVLRMHETRGKGASWNLELGPWGPRADPEQVKVAPQLYASVRIGDRVRIRVRDGRLGMPWFRVVARSS